MNDNRDQSTESLTFSQRYGYEPLPEPMKLEELSGDLRRKIWNEVREFLLSLSSDPDSDDNSFKSEGKRFIERVLGKFLKKSEDEIIARDLHPYDAFRHILDSFKQSILQDTFNRILDLVELIVNDRSVESRFADKIACLFEAHAAAYWLDTSCSPSQFIPRVTREQGEATRAAIETIHKNDMEGASTHLRDASAHINTGQFADSIADSIHAVESVACIICPKEKTLGKALDALQKKGLLKHPALKEAFSNLYGYTSDEQGIRHALLDKDSPDVDIDEAMFMFGACASFAAYLASKHQQTK